MSRRARRAPQRWSIGDLLFRTMAPVRCGDLRADAAGGLYRRLTVGLRGAARGEGGDLAPVRKDALLEVGELLRRRLATEHAVAVRVAAEGGDHLPVQHRLLGAERVERLQVLRRFGMDGTRERD